MWQEMIVFGAVLCAAVYLGKRYLKPLLSLPVRADKSAAATPNVPSGPACGACRGCSGGGCH